MAPRCRYRKGFIYRLLRCSVRSLERRESRHRDEDGHRAAVPSPGLGGTITVSLAARQAADRGLVINLQDRCCWGDRGRRGDGRRWPICGARIKCGERASH